MKKIITIIFCLLVSTTMAFAQHLVDFKGVNLDNDLADFVEQMQSNGLTFKQNETKLHFVIMQGMMYGKMRDVYILYTPKTRKVYEVSVLFDEEVSTEERIRLYDVTKRKFSGYAIEEDPTKHTWKIDFEESGRIEFECSMNEYYEDGEDYLNSITFVDGINLDIMVEEVLNN
ncbi:MAG: hypothetical protein VZR53_10360 [Prevotella sp.]|nr:hypothetical protein [Prevotella sp.]